MRWSRAAAVPFHTDTTALLAPSAHTRGPAVWSTGVAAAQPGWECCRPVARAGGKRAPAFLTGCAETQVGWAAVGWGLVRPSSIPGEGDGRQQAPALVADRPGDLDPLGLEGGHVAIEDGVGAVDHGRHPRCDRIGCKASDSRP